MARPRKNPAPADSLSLETTELAHLILGGIRRARPNDPNAPETVDDLVEMALQHVKTATERVFPDYFCEIKPACPVLKSADA